MSDMLLQTVLGLTLFGAYWLFVAWAHREAHLAQPVSPYRQYAHLHAPPPPAPVEEPAPAPPVKRRCGRRRMRERARRAIVVVS